MKTQKALTSDYVLETLTLSPHPLNKRDLARTLHVKGSGPKQQLKDLLKELLNQGAIYKTAQKTYVLEKERPKPVESAALPPIVGIVHQTGSGYTLLSCDRRQRKSYVLTGDLPYRAGDLVLADISHSKTRGYRLTGEVAQGLKILGHQDDPQAVSLIALHQHQIPHTSLPEVELEATRQAALPLTLQDREDLTAFELVTIDGEDARDFDDAVWAKPDPTSGTPDAPGWHILVAIADVSFYVRPSTALDLEAQRRGNSVYFADRVIPMLPEALSNGACSLVPCEKRACLAVHLWIDGKGKLKKHRFVRGLMESRARLTYTAVQQALDGQPDRKTQPFLPLLTPLFQAFQILKKAREKRGTLDFDLPEYKVRFNDKGELSGIVPQKRLLSHQLIEEFMILANVAAAVTLEQKRAPCLYRVHEPPPEEKLIAFAEMLKGLGIPFAKGQVMTAKAFNHLLAYSQKTPFQGIVHELVLRSQSQACYTPRNQGHFGLSLPRYAHFTSPIRRYADLVIHRSLVRTLGLGEGGLAFEDPENLQALGDHLCVTERRADIAERETLARYVALFLEKHLGETFEGRITGVASFGFFVSLEGSGAEGLVPVALLRRDYYDFDPQKHRLTGRRTRKTYTLGDKLSVCLTQINPLANMMTLEPVN